MDSANSVLKRTLEELLGQWVKRQRLFQSMGRLEDVIQMQDAIAKLIDLIDQIKNGDS